VPDYDTVCLKAASTNVGGVLPDNKVTFAGITVELIRLARVSRKECYGVLAVGPVSRIGRKDAALVHRHKH